MDKAKAAITDFMSRSGHHDTTVHEAVAPAVTQEVVKPHVHEEVNTAIDKEVHQDHYHRTIQPVQDREVLPERHEAKIGAVQHREFDHRDHDATKRALVADQARFKDERRVDATTHSQSVAPVVGGEHVHHHIHETIQPVIQKETIQPSVVHTTVPIHEVHHNKATHHETTALPAMTMEQFKAKGGSLHGREERYDEFEGVPKSIGGVTAGAAVAGLAHKGTHSEHAKHGDFEGTGVHGTHHGTHHGTAGLAGAGAAGVAAHNRRGSTSSLSSSDGEGGRRPSRRSKLGLFGKNKDHADRNHDGKVDAHDLKSTSHHSNVNAPVGEFPIPSQSEDISRVKKDGYPKALCEDKSRQSEHGQSNQHMTGTGAAHHNTTTTTTTTTTRKPSLMDKLNPKVDADGDGKAGFMK